MSEVRRLLTELHSVLEGPETVDLVARDWPKVAKAFKDVNFAVANLESWVGGAEMDKLKAAVEDVKQMLLKRKPQLSEESAGWTEKDYAKAAEDFVADHKDNSPGEDIPKKSSLESFYDDPKAKIDHDPEKLWTHIVRVAKKHGVKINPYQ